MDVYWLEQRDADVPAQNDWMSAGEVARLNGMRFEKRRMDWRLGRWTAKRALAVHLNLPAHLQALGEIEIRSAPSGAPEAFLADKPAGVGISLSHRAGIALCAVAVSSAALGCDLEVVEPRSDAFFADYFTSEEQAWVAQAPAADRPQLLALLWSAKESALKALRTGLRLDTRCLVVNPIDAIRPAINQWDDPAPTLHPSCDSQTWHPLQVRFGADQVFQGWWKLAHNVLRTLVATPSPSKPVPLVITR
jgi:4'-phosphopantetheinyl transferase